MQVRYLMLFVAYEQAMKRWAVLCNKQMRVIPPHPSQLSNLILLRTATERRVCSDVITVAQNLIFCRMLNEKEQPN